MSVLVIKIIDQGWGLGSGSRESIGKMKTGLYFSLREFFSLMIVYKQSLFRISIEAMKSKVLKLQKILKI